MWQSPGDGRGQGLGVRAYSVGSPQRSVERWITLISHDALID